MDDNRYKFFLDLFYRTHTNVYVKKIRVFSCDSKISAIIRKPGLSAEINELEIKSNCKAVSWFDILHDNTSKMIDKKIKSVQKTLR